MISLSIKYIERRTKGSEGTSGSSRFIKITLSWLRPEVFPTITAPSHRVIEITWTATLHVHLFGAVSLYRKASVGLTFEDNVQTPLLNMVFCPGSRLQPKALYQRPHSLILHTDTFSIALTKAYQTSCKTSYFFLPWISLRWSLVTFYLSWPVYTV